MLTSLSVIKTHYEDATKDMQKQYTGQTDRQTSDERRRTDDRETNRRVTKSFDGSTCVDAIAVGRKT